MSTTDASPGLETGTWVLDPTNSSVEFRTKTFWGLMTVKGTFSKYEGYLDLAGDPAIKLTIDASSIDTKNQKRDTHLRSEHFFGVEQHPQITFEASDVRLDGERLHVGGTLAAGGSEVPVQLTAGVVTAGEAHELEASVTVNHRRLGMTFNQAGMIKPDTTLIVRGRLIKQD